MDILHNKQTEKGKEVWKITSPRTILDIDLKKVIKKVENRYKVKLPRKVIAVDYAEDGDLYIRFKHVEKPIGEPSNDSNVIFFYSNGGGIVALEIRDLKQFT